MRSEKGGHFAPLSALRIHRSCSGPGYVQECPAERLRPTPIQAFSSRAGLQDGTRWQSTTPSNYQFGNPGNIPATTSLDGDSRVGLGAVWQLFLNQIPQRARYPQPNPAKVTKKGVMLHPQSSMKSIDPAASPAEPGFARPSDSGQARSKPFPHAPVFRMALVGKAQLPQTTNLGTPNIY